MTSFKCKLCFSEMSAMIAYKYGPVTCYRCLKCCKYFIYPNENTKIYDENIEVLFTGSMELDFYSETKVIKIFKLFENRPSELITELPLNELTHEIAIQWVNRFNNLKSFI